MKKHFKQYTLEAAGTFLLVFLLTGSLILTESASGALVTAAVALVYGLALTGLTLTLGKYTGAHLNPAVTLTYAIQGSFPWKDTLPFILSQCAGALAASALLKYLFPASATLGILLPTNDDTSAFIQEFTLSLIFLLAILTFDSNTPAQRRRNAVATGAIVLLAAWITGPVSGTGMNPARALAPALLSGQTTGLWIYLAAPLCAASAAAGLQGIYETIRSKKTVP